MHVYMGKAHNGTAKVHTDCNMLMVPGTPKASNPAQSRSQRSSQQAAFTVTADMHR